MRWCLGLLVAVVELGCGVEAPTPCQRAPSQRQALEVGVAHVAGDYHPGDGVFLLSGAADAQRLGTRTLKVYLTPEYATKYPAPDWADVRSLAALAETPQYRALFSQPFDTFVLTTYSFSLGVGDPWRSSDDAALYEAERAELEALTETLLRSWAGSGKTFVLQNWEGDWALLGGQPRTTRVPAERSQRMRRWLEARQAGVAAARARVKVSGVEVRHAAELNLVVDADGSRVVDEVLPGLCVDEVSYSAWDALWVDISKPLADQRASLRASLTKAVDRIRAAAGPDVDVSLGEVGFAENEHPAAQTPALWRETLETSRALGLRRAIYWQVYDNECEGSACRGLWLVRPDGSFSDVASAMR